MEKFKIAPEVLTYSLDEFHQTFEFKETDFILISKSIHQQFFSDLENVHYRSDYAKGEPDSDGMNALIRDFKKSNSERIIAIGGGSVMDMAKVLVVCKDDDSEALFLDPKDLHHNYPLVLIPTTCGSGSEVSNISILELKSKQTKLGLAKDELFADQAILIPELLHSISDFYFITSSIDGLVHAIESYLSSRSNTYTRLFQEKAISLYLNGMIELSNGKDKTSLFKDFMTASNMAGIAFSNTGTGCVHGISYPLSGTYHVTHGLANSIFLVEVLKMYEKLDNRVELTQLKSILKDIFHTEDVFSSLQELLGKLLDIPKLSSLGMKEEEIESFSESVIQYQQRLMSNGYINLNFEQVKAIYRNLF